MKLGLFGRMALALVATLALGLGMTACGGGTIAYIWVLGSQFKQIAGFKVDNYTGNLTNVPKSPFTTSGVNPVSILVRPGGRYVYVINQGENGGPTTTNGVTTYSKGSSSGIAVYAVGGDGTLTYLIGYQSQGYVPVWAQFDGTGSYLYVLDKYSPSGDGNGAITAYSVDSTTGRLTLVGNSQTQVNGVNTYYFEVGPNPIMMKTAGSCLFTANTATGKGNQTITPYGINATNGQLTISTNQTISTNATTISSINGNGQYIFLTDSGSNTIFPYTVSGSSCSLSILSGGAFSQTNGATKPVNTLIDNSGKYLYVLNQGTVAPATTPCCSISGYTLNATAGTLTEITGSPYSVGAGPVCAVEDTTNQYIYISNHDAGTVTGKIIDSTTGRISDLTRGATFTSTGLAGCLALSGNIT